MKRLILIISICLFSLCFFIFNSTLGLKSLITITQRIIPGQLHIEKVEGKLTQPITLINIDYRNKYLHFKADKIEFRWQPLSLLKAKLVVNHLHVFHSQLQMTSSPSEEKQTSSTSSLTWLKFIEIKRAEAIDFSYTQHNKHPLLITRFSLINQGQGLNNIIIDSPLGNVKAQTLVYFSPHLAWKITLKASHLNPNFYLSDWTGNINLHIHTEGQWGKEDKNFLLTMDELNGELNHLPIKGSVDIHYDGSQFLIESANIELLNSQAIFSGNIDKRLNIDWKIISPNLSYVIPDSKGSLISQGQLHGTLDQPIVHGKLQINQAKWQDIAASAIFADINSIPNTNAFAINLQAKRISIDDYVIPQLKLASTLAYLKNKLTGKVNLAIDKNNQLQGNLTLIDLDKEIPKVDANFSLNFNLLNQVVTSKYFKIIEGNMSGNAVIKGQLSHPTINLHTQLTHGSLYLPSISQKITNIQLITGYKSQGPLTIAGDFNLGKNKAKMTGEIALETPNMPMTFTLEGEALEINKVREYQVFFSPHLTLVYDTTNNMTLKGNIIIPKANITPIDFSQVTKLPDEVIIINEKKQVQKTELPLNLALQLKIQLGNEVKIKYQNLNTLLRGEVLITKSPNNLATATGTFYTVHGKYNAYGHEMIIQEGRIIYTGNMLTNPNLNIKAVKQFDTVSLTENRSQFSDDQFSPIYSGTQKLCVGVWIMGNAVQPKVTLFSDPATLSQDDILSYLVFGVPRSRINETSSISILNSLASSLNQGSNNKSSIDKFTNNVKKKLDLSDFSVGSTEIFDSTTNTTSNATTFNIGKNIGKKLSIHYKVGIFDPIYILNIKYKISPRFSIQTETSAEDNGADLIYEIEKD